MYRIEFYIIVILHEKFITFRLRRPGVSCQLISTELLSEPIEVYVNSTIKKCLYSV